MPERLRRTIRGLEKMMEPLRYHFDDLEKQVRRKPMGIDLIDTMEIIHKNVGRIEQELSSMRERVDMELLLRNDSLSDENLPLPGDTPPADEETASGSDDSQPIGPQSPPRVFAASGDPFEKPAGSDAHATRVDERTKDETHFLTPVKLAKNSGDDGSRNPSDTANPKRDKSSTASRGGKATRGGATRGDATRGDGDREDADGVRIDRSNDDTLILERTQAAE